MGIFELPINEFIHGIEDNFYSLGNNILSTYFQNLNSPDEIFLITNTLVHDSKTKIMILLKEFLNHSSIDINIDLLKKSLEINDTISNLYGISSIMSDKIKKYRFLL